MPQVSASRDSYSPKQRRLLDGRALARRLKIRVMPFNIDKLSDEFGQYELVLICPCGHSRKCYPKTLAAFAGWDARLVDIAKRMRCSKCGHKGCTWRAVEMQKPRGYRSH